jgi:AraC-like DNA-binding protein
MSPQSRLLPSAVRSKADLRHFAIEVLMKWVADLDRDRLRLHFPRREGLMRLIPGMPFHLWPELFLQISGSTTFEFPGEICRVEPGEICLVSRGLPHRERVRAGKGAFFNLVIAYWPDHVRFHLAHQDEQGAPAIVVSNQLEEFDGAHLSEQLKNIADWHHEGDAAHRLAVKGTLLANLSMVLVAIKQPPPEMHEPFKVMQARQLVMRHLSEARLSVDWLGRMLQSSPDYLSRLFREATGKPLAAYITERRMVRARDLLESSALNISEISQATGYEDPSYFTRVFRREIEMAPRQYRERMWKKSEWTEVVRTGRDQATLSSSGRSLS